MTDYDKTHIDGWLENHRKVKNFTTIGPEPKSVLVYFEDDSVVTEILEEFRSYGAEIEAVDFEFNSIAFKLKTVTDC